MDMHWLEDVLVLLEEKNMTRAAARRNITQPAFSRRIRGFENWLGVPVLERGANRVEISDALLSNEAEIRALAARLKGLQSSFRHFDPAQSKLVVAAQHSVIYSIFAEMALRARHVVPTLNFRLRAGNLKDCASLFLRGETDLLICYEQQNTSPLPFGETIRRERCGTDHLLPVVGGALRYRVRDGVELPEDTPAIVYPEDSYFGEILAASKRAFATRSSARNPACETAFASGLKEMAMSGLGIGWLPVSMVYREIESGELISLASSYGQEPLEIVLYARVQNPLAATLMDLWRINKN